MKMEDRTYKQYVKKRICLGHTVHQNHVHHNQNDSRKPYGIVSFHRVDSQKTKCGFGLKGVCCRLCSNGPCRITPTAPRGI